MKRITQVDARRYRKRMLELESILQEQRSEWASAYPGGSHICTERGVSPYTTVAMKTARRLGHAIVAVQNHATGEVMFYALPLPESKS